MRSKADYDLALQVVGTVIHAWDPHDLLSGGAPREEFDMEIARVVAEIPRIKSPEDAALAVSRVFSISFDDEGFTPEDCARVGRELFDALTDNGLV
jgi:hypothetical protein